MLANHGTVEDAENAHAAEMFLDAIGFTSDSGQLVAGT